MIGQRTDVFLYVTMDDCSSKFHQTVSLGTRFYIYTINIKAYLHPPINLIHLYTYMFFVDAFNVHLGFLDGKTCRIMIILLQKIISRPEMCEICKKLKSGHVPKAPNEGETLQKNNNFSLWCYMFDFLIIIIFRDNTV